MRKIYFKYEEMEVIKAWCAENLHCKFHFNYELPCDEEIEGAIEGTDNKCACSYYCLTLHSEEDYVLASLRWA